MKIADAKKIPLEQLLEKLGHHPARRLASQLWYRSPLRQENTPSFKVNADLNLWFDFGLGVGGTIIDLAAAIENGCSIPDALRFIERTMDGAEIVRVFQPSPARSPSPPALTLLDSGPVRTRSMRAYLRVRGIDARKCGSEIQEVLYQAGGRSYVALGFANDQGGFELRNKWFKGTLGSKAISTRPGNAETALVFEGFFDYLTYVTLHGRPKALVVVLNSVAMKERAVEFLRQAQTKRVELFRDNDPAGDSLVSYFREQLPASEVMDKAGDYLPSKDLNEWYLAAIRR